MKDFTIYSPTGNIIRTGTCQDTLFTEQLLNANEFILEGKTDMYKEYISEGVKSPRPAQSSIINVLTIIADGGDIVTISEAPSGTFTATNTITRETVTGSIAGTDTFSTTVPGTYRIKIESWPYLDFETTITAVAP